MTDRELMQQALDAVLEDWSARDRLRLAIALRERLARQEPAREWVGLTTDERLDAERLSDQQYMSTRGDELRPSWATIFARAIEAKLKERNS